MEVIKRDGRKEPFNVEKIVNAVRKAYVASDVKLSEEVENKLRNLFTVGDLIDIEENSRQGRGSTYARQSYAC